MNARSAASSPSPCTLCISDAPCPCAQFLAWDEATNGTPAERECCTCLDAEWLLLAGEIWETTAARLHLTPESLRRHLQRHRPDLVPPRRDRGAA